ncbi:MAG TPA: hypothetical protein VGN76_04505 [Gemmatimonadales bacterium]|jgi:hypothetical protein|nr:hypothetical protein [Gemmatimonadales bacterium]
MPRSKNALLSLLTLAAACGVNVSSPNQPTGTITFELDAQTCPPGEVSIDMLVDGVFESREAFSPGTLRSIEASVGTHIASAVITDTTSGFAQASVVVPKFGDVTYLMVCR